jgi:hypothetical protein
MDTARPRWCTATGAATRSAASGRETRQSSSWPAPLLLASRARRDPVPHTRRLAGRNQCGWSSWTDAQMRCRPVGDDSLVVRRGRREFGVRRFEDEEIGRRRFPPSAKVLKGAALDSVNTCAFGLLQRHTTGAIWLAIDSTRIAIR